MCGMPMGLLERDAAGVPAATYYSNPMLSGLLPNNGSLGLDLIAREQLRRARNVFSPANDSESIMAPHWRGRA